MVKLLNHNFYLKVMYTVRIIPKIEVEEDNTKVSLVSLIPGTARLRHEDTIAEMVTNFDEDKFHPLILIPYKNRLIIADGNHRAALCCSKRMEHTGVVIESDADLQEYCLKYLKTEEHPQLNLNTFFGKLPADLTIDRFVARFENLILPELDQFEIESIEDVIYNSSLVFTVLPN